MNNFLAPALEAVAAQQPKERSAVWMVGEQLKDMLRAEPENAEIVLQDLQVADMSLTNCEKKIKEYADKHKTGNFACVTPDEAERIIREFYGLPERLGTRGVEDAAPYAPPAGKVLNLEDFF